MQDMLNKNLKKQNRFIYLLVVLILIALLNFIHISTPTYASFISKDQVNKSNFSAAFIFPKTLETIIDKTNIAAIEAVYQCDKAKELLLKSKTDNLDKLEQNFNAIVEHVRDCRRSAINTEKRIDELEVYAIRAKNDLIKAQKYLSDLNNRENVSIYNLNLAKGYVSSAKRVNNYVQSAYSKAKNSLVISKNAVAEANNIEKEILLIIAEREKKEPKKNEDANVDQRISDDTSDLGNSDKNTENNAKGSESNNEDKKMD